MKIFFILFTLFSLNCYSQNSESYFCIRITEGMYDYLDSCEIGKMDQPDSCDCRFDVTNKFWQIANKQDAYDSLLLNEFADEFVIDDFLLSLKKEFHKIKFDSKDKISHVYLKSDIKRLSNRLHLWTFKRKVRYKITIQVYYKPILI